MLNIVKTLSDIVLVEEDHNYSKDKKTVPDTVTVVMGEVTGQITANGNHVPLNPAAVDGSEVAAGVAITEKTTAAGTGEVFVFTRHALLSDFQPGTTEPAVVWPDGISAGEKAIAIDQLKSIGVVIQ